MQMKAEELPHTIPVAEASALAWKGSEVFSVALRIVGIDHDIE